MAKHEHETVDMVKGDVTQAAHGGRIRIPARVLHLAAMAAKESTRYAIDALFVHDYGGGSNVAVATDGHRLGMATWDRALFDTMTSVLIPMSLCKAALKLTPTVGGDDDGGEYPEVVVTDTPDGYRLEMHTADGPVVFTFDTPQAAFPPYRDIIPKFEDSIGIRAIGINGKMVADTLKIILNVMESDGYCVTVQLPSKADKPFGFAVRDDLIQLQAIAMPVSVGLSDWADDDEQPADAPTDADAWRSRLVSGLSLPVSVVSALGEAGYATIGKVADHTTSGRRLSDIAGIGPTKGAQIEQALATFWAKHPEYCKGGEA